MLAGILAEALGLQGQRKDNLKAWRLGHQGDLGLALAAVVSEIDCGESHGQLDILEVDRLLGKLAARSRFFEPSSDGQRSPTSGTNRPADLIRPILARMDASQAKWLVRLLLKNMLPLKLHMEWVMKQLHFLLPEAYHVQHDLRTASALIQKPEIRRVPRAVEDWEVARLYRLKARHFINPQINIPIAIPETAKARGSRHAAQLLTGKRFWCETKYDGERMQVHVSRSKRSGELTFQIFSKSGRNSTADRSAVHAALRRALRMDSGHGRPYETSVVVEAELCVWNEKTRAIQEFDKVRNFVTRAGRETGVYENVDRENEHLIMVFFDCLCLDGLSLLGEAYEQRRRVLDDVVQVEAGWSMLAERVEIDLREDFDTGLKRLRQEYAAAIEKRQEGFILKPADSTCYWSKDNGWIKLKKDFIEGLGDTADLTIVGGYFDPKRAKERKVNSTKMCTSFLIGALTNKIDVQKGAKPCFQVLCSLSYDIPMPMLASLNSHFEQRQERFTSVTKSFCQLMIPTDLPKPDIVYKEPLVVAIKGGSFVKPFSHNLYVPRWPRLQQIHYEREFTEALSVNELQELAIEALAPAPEWEAQVWTDALEMRDEIHGDANTVLPPRGSAFLRDIREAKAVAASNAANALNLDDLLEVRTAPEVLLEKRPLRPLEQNVVRRPVKRRKSTGKDADISIFSLVPTEENRRAQCQAGTPPDVCKRRKTNELNTSEPMTYFATPPKTPAKARVHPNLEESWLHIAQTNPACTVQLVQVACLSLTNILWSLDALMESFQGAKQRDAVLLVDSQSRNVKEILGHVQRLLKNKRTQIHVYDFRLLLDRANPTAFDDHHVFSSNNG
ncbi:DNA ligase (ATP) [Saitoella coloradoensis]